MPPRPVGGPGSPGTTGGDNRRRAETRHTTVVFEYVGPTQLVVIGPVSGRRYLFDRPGSRVAVDPVDRPGVGRVPNLRLVAPG